MAINIMEKTRHLFSVVLRGYVGLGISQDTFKGGRELVETTLLLRIHVRRIRGIDIVLENCGAARRQGSSERMMERRPAEATEVEKTSTL